MEDLYSKNGRVHTYVLSEKKKKSPPVGSPVFLKELLYYCTPRLQTREPDKALTYPANASVSDARKWNQKDGEKRK